MNKSVWPGTLTSDIALGNKNLRIVLIDVDLEEFE